MDNEIKSRLSFVIFIIIILLIVLGGVFLVNRNNNNHNISEDLNKYKVDSKKDFVYFDNYDILSEKLHFIYKDIHINLKGSDAAKITEEINKINPLYKSKLKKISEVENLDESLIIDESDDIYSAWLVDHEYYTYKNRLIININKYFYDCLGTALPSDIDSYIFNIKNGKLLSKEELLKDYELDNSEFIKIVYDKVNEIKDNIINKNSEEVMDYDKTINEINNDKYALYIDKYGHLVVNIVVFTNEINYNENIIIK